MEHTHGILTPLYPSVKLNLTKQHGEKELEDITGCRAVVGSLMYEAHAVRADISYTAAALSCSNLRPLTKHMTAVKSVLQYLTTRANFRLHINSHGIGIGIDIGMGMGMGMGMGIGIDQRLVGYTDSDCADNSADRKDKGGHAVLASNGAAVLWQSQKQGSIAMSTLKEAFMACSETSREGKWLLQLQKHINGKDLPPLPINCINQGALTVITMGIIKVHTNQIKACYHNSQDLHKCRIVNYS